MMSRARSSRWRRVCVSFAHLLTQRDKFAESGELFAPLLKLCAVGVWVGGLLFPSQGTVLFELALVSVPLAQQGIRDPALCGQVRRDVRRVLDVGTRVSAFCGTLEHAGLLAMLF